MISSRKITEQCRLRMEKCAKTFFPKWSWLDKSSIQKRGFWGHLVSSEKRINFSSSYSIFSALIKVSGKKGKRTIHYSIHELVFFNAQGELIGTIDRRLIASRPMVDTYFLTLSWKLLAAKLPGIRLKRSWNEEDEDEGKASPDFRTRSWKFLWADGNSFRTRSWKFLAASGKPFRTLSWKLFCGVGKDFRTRSWKFLWADGNSFRTLSWKFLWAEGNSFRTRSWKLFCGVGKPFLTRSWKFLAAVGKSFRTLSWKLLFWCEGKDFLTRSWKLDCADGKRRWRRGKVSWPAAAAATARGGGRLEATPSSWLFSPKMYPWGVLIKT